MDTRFPDLKGYSSTAQEPKWDSFIIQDWVEGFKICNICVLCVCVCVRVWKHGMKWNICLCPCIAPGPKETFIASSKVTVLFVL